MKAGTKARIIRYSLIICVALFLAVPSVSALSDLRNGFDVEMGTYAVYDLDEMTADDLRRNIESAVSHGTDCSIVFGESSKPVSVPVSESLVSEVMNSGAKEARIVGSDGATVFQENIQIQNAIFTKVVIGAKVPKMLLSTATLSLDLKMVAGGIVMPLKTETLNNEDALRVSYEYPNVVMAAASALDALTAMEMRLTYDKMIGINAHTEYDAIPYAATYSCSESGGVCKIDIGYPAMSATGKIGNVDLVSGYGGFSLSFAGKVSSALEGSLDGGCLAITVGDDSYKMGQELSAAFIEAVKAMEASA